MTSREPERHMPQQGSHSNVSIAAAGNAAHAFARSSHSAITAKTTTKTV